MSQTRLNWRWRLLPALALLLLVLIACAPQPASSSVLPPTMIVSTVTPTALSPDSYRDRLDALPAGHPEDAEAALDFYGCVVCHRSKNNLAPSWVGVAQRAAERRSPLPAAAYLYESIVDPAAYVVDGYQDLMPKNFAKRLSAQELADILAYLLTPDAQ